MQPNTILNVAPQIEEATKELLTDFFDTQNAEEADEELNQLLQAWICTDTDVEVSKLKIADMTFFVHGLIRLTRKINRLQNEIAAADAFYSIYGQDNLETRLHELLVQWICPYDNPHKPIEIANQVDFIYCLIKLLNELEGVVLCA